MTNIDHSYKAHRFILQIGHGLGAEKLLISTTLERDACIHADISLAGFDASLYTHPPVPVGSVEFVQAYARKCGIALPDFPTYPTSIHSYLNRRVWLDRFRSAADDVFVKPVATKIFTGAIKSSITECVPDDTPVWVSTAMSFDQEWRFYIIDGNPVGYARYDDLDSEDLEPPCAIVAKIASDYYDAPVGYSLDMGYSGNQWSLIEANDGWALGYYRGGTMTLPLYMELIAKRWQQLNTLKTPHPVSPSVLGVTNP